MNDGFTEYFPVINERLPMHQILILEIQIPPVFWSHANLQLFVCIINAHNLCMLHLLFFQDKSCLPGLF